MATIEIDLPQDKPTATTTNSQLEGTYEIFGRISTPNGRVVSTFERSTDATEHRLDDPNRQTTIPLAPGIYFLALVVKAAESGQTGANYTTFEVPGFDELE